jgi:hypothetical protein
MRATANLSVKGTRYYKAAELLQKGSLSSGLAIRLEHQSDNPHDMNAVAVRVKRTGAMLGHISRELAPKYASLINSGKIIEVSLTNIAKEGTYINIDIRVVYEQSDDQLAEKHSSRLWQSASTLPTEPGIYSIRHIGSGRQYIGSSNNIKDRLHSHIRDLFLGCHANHALQSDFSRFGANYFEAQVLARGVSPSNLPTVEADRISSFLNAGAALYNLTEDGQGTGRNFHSHSDSEPVSDRLARQRAEAERQRIYDVFEPKLAALLPQINFWAYFTATFVGALILLPILTPKIKDGSLFVLSAVLAFVVSLFINRHSQEKAKQTVQYQNLVKQRDEQLVALDNERNKAQNL